MTTEQIKTKIREKHKTLSAFARMAGIDRYELQKMFAREMSKQEQKQILDALEIVPAEDLSIPADKLELLRSKIQEAGGIPKFASDNPGFEKRHVYLAYNGEFTVQSKTVQQLFKHFGI